MAATKPIFCCQSTAPFYPPELPKPFNDPNRPVHDAIYRSFISFATRVHQSMELLNLLNDEAPESSPKLPSTITVPPPQPATPAPVLTPDALRNSPLTPRTPYAMHLASRYDYGPAYSHRYFACPLNLQDDWVEISLEQWFAEGQSFKMKAEKWDLKCEENSRFFRLTLRPNLGLRGQLPTVGGVATGT
ncbi:uncharacterized protein BP5553_03792 [Venustampulla echinocandica]|uniref:Uncharacterized protein n=1 Tax=Venustampulla echinocandica TaxID=2656787 RepID=A0A370TV85_9HELO|nr:uncharacterized protein BP5553_03792 [Venustampulla echinocandica]RDL39452.1 hypothetical protein BP5553_03792 [Venustampulla echinocandica]